ncbi:MAG: VCBS repeat-containing protein, partial [Candidatus Symbiothrix sp.]|nr:VCBS repeat-containing protein [Candidatus Symbiothrix sp.]
LPESTHGCDASILADVDGDADIEVIIASANTANIYGYNHNGSKVEGFPLRASDKFNANLCIDDIDKDGRNELIAVTNNTVQMWETNGLPSRIEWGRDRHDQFNTGEYYPVCDPEIISANTSWNSNRSICNDLIVKSGTLTVNSTCTATLSSDAMIILQSGSTLLVNGGKIMNANI